MGLFVLNLFLLALLLRLSSTGAVRLQIVSPAPSSSYASELQLSAGETLELVCEGKGQPSSPDWAQRVWEFPRPDESEVLEAAVPSVEGALLESGWRSTLRLENASHYHTGMYSCGVDKERVGSETERVGRRDNDSDSGGGRELERGGGRESDGGSERFGSERVSDSVSGESAVYVFVGDPSYPWVRSGVVPAWAVQGEEALLDCRPNNRSTRVKLMDGSQRELPPGETQSADGEIPQQLRWDPKRGFLLYPVHDRDVGIYFCRAYHHGDDQDHRGDEDHHGDPAEGDSDLMVMLHVMPRTTDLPAPVVHAEGALPHAVLGGSVTLQCSVRVAAHVFFSMEWRAPPGRRTHDRLRVTEPQALVEDAGGVRVGTINLTITNLTADDAGDYACVVTDHTAKARSTTFRLDVADGSRFFIDVATPAEQLAQRVARGRTATWVVHVVAFPAAPSVAWFAPDGAELTAAAAARFPLATRPRGKGIECVMQVLEADLPQRGTYALKINTGPQEKVVPLTLTVLAAPTVAVQPLGAPWPLGARRELWCQVLGAPPPRVQWAWRPCPHSNDNPSAGEGMGLRGCSPEGEFEPLPPGALRALSDVQWNASLWLQPTTPGFVACRAANEEGSANDTAALQLTDLPGAGAPLAAWGPAEAVVGDEVVLWCGALRDNHTAWPRWRRLGADGAPLPLDRPRMEVSLSNTSLSLRTRLRIASARAEDSGRFECAAGAGDEDGGEGPDPDAVYTLQVQEEQRPLARGAEVLNNSEWLVSAGHPLRLPCRFHGRPTPRIAWFKDGRPLSVGSSAQGGSAAEEQFRLEDGNRTLSLAFVTDADQGEYRCRAANRLAAEERWARVTLRGRRGLATPSVTALAAVLAVMACLLIPLGIYVCRERRRRRRGRLLPLLGELPGRPEALNPDLPAAEQAQLLPFDQDAWEFPRARLRLGRQLGAGAFGVVLKGEAQGLVPGEDSTTVAVKMVKRSANFAYLKALASELKIMAHLGRHLNVVNLLGACTADVRAGRPGADLLVIVEFCRFGNLHNYLLRHRAAFVDELDPRSGALTTPARVKYASLSFSEESSCSGQGDDPLAPVDYRDAAAAAASADADGCEGQCERGVGSDGGEAICMAPTGGGASVEPDWRCDYGGDYGPSTLRSICTRDLLCWAYQVARGMQYLASRKVLHGDLAARNILLADGNVVKICDFGLAKSMYADENYKKTGDSPLPIKWMALESIRDRVFSTQSDVWSFGVVLWELFSLAETPYPGMAADERLYARLQAGYRLPRPRHAPNALYRVMAHCWKASPAERPSFDALSEELGAFLEDSVRHHYLELNSAYIDMNEQRRLAGAPDYLSMLTAPDYYNLVAPRASDADTDAPATLLAPWGDATVTPSSPAVNSEGYLLMRGGRGDESNGNAVLPTTPLSAGVFSPRPDDRGKQVFTFSGPYAPAVDNPCYSALHPQSVVTDSFSNPGYVGAKTG